MKCYCCDTGSEFTLYVEDADTKFIDVIQHAWFEKTDIGYKKTYPNVKGNAVSIKDKDIVSKNFARLGQSMFEGMLDCKWESALQAFALKCRDNNIEWYVFGSISDVLRGIDINPHDIDIIVHTKDFFKLKDIFIDSVVEPFVDNKGTWVVRYFGRLCLAGVLFDIAAENRLNLENHRYDTVLWRGYNILVETFQNRYNLEIKRGRIDRIKAMETYMRKL